MEHKSIICAGYSAVMHIHTCAEEVTIKVWIEQKKYAFLSGVTFSLKSGHVQLSIENNI